MEGKRVIVDHRHKERQNKVFAVFVVIGVVVIGLVWFFQVRGAVDRGALDEIGVGVQRISDTWSQEWPEVQLVPEVDTSTDVPQADPIEDAVQKALQDREIRLEVGRQATEALNEE